MRAREKLKIYPSKVEMAELSNNNETGIKDALSCYPKD